MIAPTRLLCPDLLGLRSVIFAKFKQWLARYLGINGNVVLLAGIVIALQGCAGVPTASFSCDDESSVSKPDWVTRPDYSERGFYVGVGSAEKGKLVSKDKLIEASDNNAKMQLVQHIQVTIKANVEQSTRVSNSGVEKDALSKVTVSAEEVLHDLQVKSRWLDKATCTQYTLMAVSVQSVEKSKREKTMRNRLEKVKSLLSDGTDRDKYPDVNVRRKNLEDAKTILADIDFALIPEDVGKKVYLSRVGDALAAVNKEAFQVKGHLALIAVNPDGALQAPVLGKMLDVYRSRDRTADHLMSKCNTEQECLIQAKQQGFGMLAFLNASTHVESTPIGSKGTLTVSKTVFNIQTHKIIYGPDTKTAQVIAITKEELDWATAAEKAIQNFK